MKLAINKPVTASSDTAVKLVRQLRAVHPALRPAGEDGACAALAIAPCAHAFLDRLADLPFNTWLDTGRVLVNDRTTLPVRQKAWPALETAIALNGLAFAAWSMRDAVETLAFLKARELGEWTLADRRCFASAHGAAEAALLAVLARDHLDDGDFRALVAPFSQCLSTNAE